MTITTFQSRFFDQRGRITIKASLLMLGYFEKPLETAYFQFGKRIESDVGRPLSDITCDLLYPDMTKDAQEALRALVSGAHHALPHH